MGCCKKVTKKGRKRSLPQNESLTGEHIEGQNGYTLVRYLGILTLKIVGCKTKHKYLFEQGVKRLIDSGDADCLFDYYSGSFEAFVEEIENVESGNSEVELEPQEIEPENSSGDGSIHTVSTEGISSDNSNLEK